MSAENIQAKYSSTVNSQNGQGTNVNVTKRPAK